MGKYKIQLLDQEAANKAVPPPKVRAHGTVKPKGKITARIRRRRT